MLYLYEKYYDNDGEIVGKYVLLKEDKSQKVEWNKLRKAINHFIAIERVNEDKQPGPYFLSRKLVVTKDGDEIDHDAFVRVLMNKFIMYRFSMLLNKNGLKYLRGVLIATHDTLKFVGCFFQKKLGFFIMIFRLRLSLLLLRKVLTNQIHKGAII